MYGKKSSSEVSNEYGVPFTLRSAEDDVTVYPYGEIRIMKGKHTGLAEQRDGKERLSLGFKRKKKPRGEKTVVHL